MKPLLACTSSTHAWRSVRLAFASLTTCKVYYNCRKGRTYSFLEAYMRCIFLSRLGNTADFDSAGNDCRCVQPHRQFLLPFLLHLLSYTQCNIASDLEQCRLRAALSCRACRRHSLQLDSADRKSRTANQGQTACAVSAKQNIQSHSMSTFAAPETVAVLLDQAAHGNRGSVQDRL